MTNSVGTVTGLHQAGSAWWAPQNVEESVAGAREAEARTAFAAVVAFTLILLLSPQNWFPVLKQFRIAFLAAGIGATSLLWERWRHRRPLGLTREIVLCAALIGWAFMTIPLSYWPGGSAATITDHYLKAVIICWLIANVVTTPKRLRVLNTILMVCTIILAGTAVKNFRSGSFYQETAGVARITGYHGTLSANPNDLALMLNLLIPIGIAFLLSARKASTRALWLGVVAMNVIGVIVTFSRAGFVVLATTVAIYVTRLLRRPRDRSWAFALLAVTILSLPMLPAEYVDRLATIKNLGSDPTGSAQARWTDTLAAIQFVREHPIVGAGIGMDVLALNQVRGARWTQVHNVYLQYAVDLGIAGAVLFLALLYCVFKAANSAWRSLQYREDRRDLFLFAEALQISLIGFAVAGFFHPVAYHFYFYYIAGLALAVRSVAQQAPRAEPRSLLNQNAVAA